MTFSLVKMRFLPMKNKKLFCILFMMFFVWLPSCTNGEQPDTSVYLTFTDDTGKQITLTEQPENTAVLFSSYAEIWLLAGGEIGVSVGETIERGLLSAETVLVDAGAGKAINTELLIAAEPDFVICSEDIPAQADAAALLSASGIPAAQFRIESFTDYLRVLKIFTDITGNTDAYTTYGTELQVKTDALLSVYPPEDSAQKRILFIRAGSAAKVTKAKTAAEHFAAAMLSELGADNIADTVPILLDGLSIEEILIQDPDAIFITTMGDDAAARAYMDSVLAEETWQSLHAVREGNCHYLPKELFQYKPNARWYDAYALLAELLYEE